MKIGDRVVVELIVARVNDGEDEDGSLTLVHPDHINENMRPCVVVQPHEVRLVEYWTNISTASSILDQHPETD